MASFETLGIILPGPPIPMPPGPGKGKYLILNNKTDDEITFNFPAGQPFDVYNAAGKLTFPVGGGPLQVKVLGGGAIDLLFLYTGPIANPCPVPVFNCPNGYVGMFDYIYNPVPTE